jgi:hypothetical protein
LPVPMTAIVVMCPFLRPGSTRLDVLLMAKQHCR